MSASFRRNGLKVMDAVPCARRDRFMMPQQNIPPGVGVVLLVLFETAE